MKSKRSAKAQSKVATDGAREGVIQGVAWREAEAVTQPVHFVAPRLRANQSAAQGWAQIVQAAIRQVRANEAGARRGANVEYLHQWRVGLRRLRVMLGMARDPAWRERLAPIRKRLGAFSDLLGEARNWDVFVLDTLKPLAATGTDPGARARALVARRRSAAYHALETLTDSRDYVRTWRELARLDLQLAVPAAATLRDFARETIARRHQHLMQSLQRGDDAASLHGFRIATKKLRYTCDALESLYSGRRARRYRAALGQVQSLLGTVNDAATGRVLLDKTYVTPLAGDGHSMGMVLGWLAAQEARARAEYPKALKKLQKIETFW